MQPKEFLLRLNVCPGLGLVSKQRIWQVAAERYEFDDIAALTQLANLSARSRAKFLTNWSSPETEMTFQRNWQMPFITIIDAAYPELLKSIYCPPLVMYFMGDLTLLTTTCLAVVGARKMTQYARESLTQLLPTIIQHRITVVSGLARGVDGLSHQITLANHGKTIAVIGSGLNRVYPPEHDHLQRQIKRHGLLLSEYPLDSAPLPHHFVERNRIIAGLAQACLVVEARRKSGSLITANLALQENRNVLAIPGPINSDLSTGCNELIAVGARPVMSAQDILGELNNRFYQPSKITSISSLN
ncbi:DNA-processing protein DprA [Limosilactobacillus caecicola]|uniref:DNA-processing protein DprA n=1 Tax=Limosilactobacillus caecicola TaxID=2941332 RepID=UPI00203FDB14|nr:DNA-processing protein DprA [Limosilactobacillus caecicola]